MFVKFTSGLAIVLLAVSFVSAQQPSGKVVSGCDSAACSGGCDSGCCGDRAGFFSGRSLFGGCKSAGCDAGCDTAACGDANCGGNCGIAGCGGLRSRLGGRCGCGAGCGPGLGCRFGGGGGCDDCGTSDCWCQSNAGCRYIRGFFGWNSVQDLSTGPALEQAASFNDGFGMGLALGRQIGPCQRLEFEFSWRNNTGDSWVTTTPPPAAVPFDGQLNAYNFMTNLLRDFPGLQIGQVTPYAGAGIGVARLDGDFLVNGNDTNISETSIALQGIIGINRPINQGTNVFLEYRFLGTDKVAVHQNLTQIGDFNYYAHNVFFGLQFLR